MIERGDEGGCEGVKGDLVRLEYFNYTNQKLGCLLQESMDEIKFLGISVSFSIAHWQILLQPIILKAEFFVALCYVML